MTDLYLADQIHKGRYTLGQTVLDAGVGSGRNLPWFLENGCRVTAVDANPEWELELRLRFPDHPFEFVCTDLARMPFDPGQFDHVICNAVLHFAISDAHFEAMWSKLIHVLKPGGTLFIRTCGAMGIESSLVPLGDGRYRLPDGSDRYLITRHQMGVLRSNPDIRPLEPVKWVNVDDQRVMMTWMLCKL